MVRVNLRNITQHELALRTATALVLGAIALFMTLYDVYTFYALVIIVAGLMFAEWFELTSFNKWVQRLGGLAYIGLPAFSLIALRTYPVQVETQIEPNTLLIQTEYSAVLVIYLFAMVWATDIAAFFAGKTFGKHKLAPTLSAGKTWEGLAGGVVAASIVGLLGAFFSPYPQTLWGGLLIGAVIAIVGQISDLFESALKRRAGVKDSGTFLPGHGGILDRVDALIFTAPLFALLALL